MQNKMRSSFLLVKLHSPTLRFPLRFQHTATHPACKGTIYVCADVCTHTQVTSAVHRLGLHKTPSVSNTYSHPSSVSSWALPSTQRRGTPETAIRKCPWTGFHCSLNIMRSSLHPTRCTLGMNNKVLQSLGSQNLTLYPVIQRDENAERTGKKGWGCSF